MRKLTTNEGQEQRLVRIDQACMRYSLGRNTMRIMGEDARAVVRVGKCLLFDIKKLDDYVDTLAN